jgi:hypothetical protein
VLNAHIVHRQIPKEKSRSSLRIVPVAKVQKALVQAILAVLAMAEVVVHAIKGN